MDAKKTALLVIDMQVGLVDKPPFNRDSLLTTIQTMLTKARTAHIPIIYMQDKDVGEGIDSVGWQIHDSVVPQSDDIVIRKPEADSFYGTNLKAELEKRAIRNLVIMGMTTEQCVYQTTRRAYDLGYKATLVKDGHSTFDLAWITATQVIQHHNYILACTGTEEHYIDVQPADSIAFET